jgi:hypothetical protein
LGFLGFVGFSGAGEGQEFASFRGSREMVAFDERHHTFLQALMRRGPLPEGESKKMFRELFSSSDGSLLCLALPKNIVEVGVIWKCEELNPTWIFFWKTQNETHIDSHVWV